jgi:hypothetical protein
MISNSVQDNNSQFGLQVSVQIFSVDFLVVGYFVANIINTTMGSIDEKGISFFIFNRLFQNFETAFSILDEELITIGFSVMIGLNILLQGRNCLFSYYIHKKLLLLRELFNAIFNE